MDTEQVSVGIEQLVDHLRTNRLITATLGYIASVTGRGGRRPRRMTSTRYAISRDMSWSNSANLAFR